MSRVRDPLLLAAALILLCTGVFVSVQATHWLGEPFPGFLVLDNGVVASAGLAHWPATDRGDIFQLTVEEYDGRVFEDPSEFRSYVEELPIGSPVVYRFSGEEPEQELSIRTRFFGLSDFGLLFGAYLFCGFGIGSLALAIRYMRGKDPTAIGTFIPLWIVAMYSLTAVDLYGPYFFFRLHVLCETFLLAAMIHLAMAFPEPSRWLIENPRGIRIPYAIAGLFALAAQLSLYSPSAYVVTHQLSLLGFGAGLAIMIVSQIVRWVRSPHFETRERIKIVVLGCAAALGPQVVLAAWSVSTGGKAPQNLMAFTGVLFPIAIAHAVIRHNLLGVDDLVRRSLHYLVFTAVVTVTYAGCFAAFDALLKESDLHQSSVVALALGVLSVSVLMPMRDRLQQLVDAAFFRTSYNFARILERTSERLASAMDLQVVYGEISRTVETTLHPAWTALYLRRNDEKPLEAVEASPLAVPELLDLLRRVEESSLPVENTQGCLAVPFRIEDDLRAVLLLGPARSGRLYGGDDRRLLLTLAHQGAVSVQNALAVDELRAVNLQLEARVEGRTEELNAALSELQHKNELLTRLSLTDSLTGLHNRAFLDEALVTEHSRSRRLGTDLTILLADIDHFKLVNDRHGHLMGDDVLREVSGVIQEKLRSSDVAGRYGGEEFLIILSEKASTKGGEIFAERLRASVEELQFRNSRDESLSVTISVGVATLSSSHRSVDDLIADADTALYRAKDLGRNRVEVQEDRR